MPRYLIPKDNGRWAIFSTVSNCLIADDLTDNEYIELSVQSTAHEARRLAEAEIADMRAGTDTPEFDYEFATLLHEQTRREAADAAAENAA